MLENLVLLKKKKTRCLKLLKPHTRSHAVSEYSHKAILRFHGWNFVISVEQLKSSLVQFDLRHIIRAKASENVIFLMLRTLVNENVMVSVLCVSL